MGIFRSKPKEPQEEKPKPKPKQELSDADKASLELKRARDNLKRQQNAAELCIQQEKDMARELIKKGEKSKAVMVLKRKAMKEKLLERARGQMINVETMIANIAEADNNLKVFELLKQGNTTLKSLQDQMSIDDINDILDDTAESLRVQEEISAALSQSLNTNEQAEIDAEVAAMMELMDQGVDPFAGEVPEPQPVAARPTKAPVEEKKVEKKVVKAEEEPNYEDMLPDAPTHTPQAQVLQQAAEEEQEQLDALLA